MKRVLPRTENVNRRGSSTTSKVSAYFFHGFDGSGKDETDEESGIKSDGTGSGMNSGGAMGSWASGRLQSFVGGCDKTRSNGKSMSGATYNKLKEDFIEEMRYLSRLRHPCVTTVMGKWRREDKLKA